MCDMGTLITLHFRAFDTFLTPPTPTVSETPSIFGEFFPLRHTIQEKETSIYDVMQYCITTKHRPTTYKIWLSLPLDLILYE